MLNSLDASWYEQSKMSIHKTFEGKNSRSKVTSSGAKKLNKKNDQYAISFMTVKTKYCNWIESSHPSFESLFSENKKFKYIQNIIKKCEDIVNAESSGYAFSFITVAAEYHDFQQAQKHLHPKLNGDVCNVWSFPIPLYFEPEYINKFCYLSKVHQLTQRHYLDYSHVDKLSGDWSSVDIPNDGSLISLRFDGSRLPHFVSFTKNVYFWLVFDGVRVKSNFTPEIRVENHDINV